MHAWLLVSHQRCLKCFIDRKKCRANWRCFGKFWMYYEDILLPWRYGVCWRSNIFHNTIRSTTHGRHQVYSWCVNDYKVYSCGYIVVQSYCREQWNSVVLTQLVLTTRAWRWMSSRQSLKMKIGQTMIVYSREWFIWSQPITTHEESAIHQVWLCATRYNLYHYCT